MNNAGNFAVKLTVSTFALSINLHNLHKQFQNFSQLMCELEFLCEISVLYFSDFVSYAVSFILTIVFYFSICH